MHIYDNWMYLFQALENFRTRQSIIVSQLSLLSSIITFFYLPPLFSMEAISFMMQLLICAA